MAIKTSRRLEPVECPCCNNGVSPSAPACMTCGHPISPPARQLDVVVTGVEISFIDLVVVIFKAVLASIPALVVAAIVVFLVQLAGCAMVMSSGF